MNVAYRGDDTHDPLAIPTARGTLAVELGPTAVSLALGGRGLTVEGEFATRIAGKHRTSQRIAGELLVARGTPREDLGIWAVEAATARRLFGVEPPSLLDEAGLPGLARLDALVPRLRDAFGQRAHAVEIGSGHALDKVLVTDRGDRLEIFARRLFRDHARRVLEVHRDGRIAIAGGGEARVTSRFGITVRGDYLRFADRHGGDVGGVAIPWIGPEDRQELARRIGRLVDR